jgi:hypothetical protein
VEAFVKDEITKRYPSHKYVLKKMYILGWEMKLNREIDSSAKKPIPKVLPRST